MFAKGFYRALVDVIVVVVVDVDLLFCKFP